VFLLFSPVSVNRGRACLPRSANSRTASKRPTAQRGPPSVGRERQRGHPPGHAVRWCRLPPQPRLASATSAPPQLHRVRDRWGTCAGSRSAANSTSHTRPRCFPIRPAAECSASRVLPQPPEPVSVTRRASSITRSISRPARRCGARSWSARPAGCTGARPASAAGGLGWQIRGTAVTRAQRVPGHPESTTTARP
jgi:hypothetical protein